MIKDAIETLEYLLEQIDNGFDEGYKTMNSLFVKDFVVQAIKEIEQAEKQQALDKKADNARELGLDYEPEEFVRWSKEKEFIAKVTDVSDVPFAMACLNEEGKIVEYGPYQITFAHEIDHIPLYTKDQLQHEWVGLTDDEVQGILDCKRGGWVDIKKVEQILKEKNT